METMMASTSREVITIDSSDDEEDDLYPSVMKDQGGCFMKFQLNDSGQFRNNEISNNLPASDVQSYNNSKTRIIDENDLDIKDDYDDDCLYYNDIKNNEEMGTSEESNESTKAIGNNDNNKYECDECQKTYSTKRGLQRHEKTHGITTFECDRCNKCFSQFSSLKNHRQTHPPLDCPHCYLTFSSQAEMDKHEETHAPPPKPSRKKSGEKSQKSEKSEDKPEKSKTNSDMFTCDQGKCKYYCKSFKKLRLHTIKAHKIVLHQCSYCFEILKSKEEREQHKNYDCPKNEFKCHICLKRFPYDTTLKRHRSVCEIRKSIDTHTDEEISIL